MAALYETLTERYGAAAAQAFFRALDDIRKRAELGRLTAAIEARQIEEALNALHLEGAAYDELAEILRQAHAEGGRTAAESMPRRDTEGNALVVRFSARNPEAEQWLRDHSSELVTRITDDQRSAVRAELADAMEKGVNPRNAALRIVGAIDKTSGKRSGGILGLTEVQAGYVRDVREELSSGDPKAMSNYLSRARRDKRFDRTVERAIRDGTKVPPEVIGRMAAAYSNRLLALRGETIGRVEAITALQKGRFQAYEQAIDKGQLVESAVTKRWRSAGDFRVRHTHRAMNGDRAAFREGFQSPSGASLLHPMDTSLGAGPDEIIGCRCTCEYVVDWLSGVG